MNMLNSLTADHFCIHILFKNLLQNVILSSVCSEELWDVLKLSSCDE